MHITFLLKRNIFTGLWHRTLPTLHSLSAQTNSPPSSFSTTSQPVHPLGFWVCNSAVAQESSHEHRPRVSPDTQRLKIRNKDIKVGVQ